MILTMLLFMFDCDFTLRMWIWYNNYIRTFPKETSIPQTPSFHEAEIACGYGIINWTLSKEKKVASFIMRRKIDKPFKLAAVKLVVEDQLPVGQVSKELYIHYNSLYKWIRE